MSADLPSTVSLLLQNTLLPYSTGIVPSCQVLAVQELRRGVDPACVHCLAFSRGDKPDWLALSSDKVSLT